MKWRARGRLRGLLLIAVLAACSTSPRTRPQGELIELNEKEKSITLGMMKKDALSIYPPEMTSLISQAIYNGRRLEEWQVAGASYTWTGVRTSRFETWLYFLDDRLVEMNTKQLDYKNNPDLIIEWR